MVAVLASTQHGVVAFWQLIEVGLRPGAIKSRVHAGRLHRIYRGVFAVGHPSLSREGQLIAAVLAYGPDALLGQWSAAELWKFTSNSRPLIDVVSAADRRSRPGIAFHQIKTLDPGDRTKRHNIPVTSPVRTLLDVATVAAPAQLASIVEEAGRLGWLNRSAMQQLIERNAGRSGVKALRAALEELDPSARWTRSELEALFLRTCRAHGIQPPIVNARVEGFEVDCLWPAARLIVELDGYEFHRTPAAFERDRRRDALLKRAGYEVLRVTYAWLTSDPDGVADTVRTLLERRS